MTLLSLIAAALFAGHSLWPSPQPPGVIQAQAPAAQEQRSDVAIGLAGIADWSPQSPFIDVMKSARPWIGHLPGRWGGREAEELAQGGYLDAEGWPTSVPPDLGSIGTLVLTDMPEAAVSLAGRYVLSFDGRGIVEVSGRAQAVRYGENEITFDYTPGPGPVEIRIQRSAPDDPVRRIRVMQQAHVALAEAGEIFNPDWIARIDGFVALRFMDWMGTNGSTQGDWAARPRAGDYTYARAGVPAEVMVALANRIGADPWFNMPHLADDTYLRSFAQLVKAALDPERRAYVEFSNEVWNWQFPQTGWADEQARARWNEADKGMQFYGMRAAQMTDIWRDVFADEAAARLVTVISSQTGWLGLEQEVLTAPLWQAEAPGVNRPPVASFDAYAITGYFAGILGREDRGPMVHGWLDQSAKAAEENARAKGLTGAALEAEIAAHRYDLASTLAVRELYDGSLSGDPVDTLADLLGRTWPYHAKVAQDAGLDLIMYEGGTHLVGLGPQVDDEELTGFFTHFNYTPEMGLMYTVLLEGWRDVGGQLFNAFVDVYAPSKWGSWGNLRHLDDSNPRWDALTGFE